MSRLTPDAFPTFYRALHSYEPFPWQCRLVERITANRGRWPRALDLPTSTGKTSAIDVAVFLLALQAGKPLEVRNAALRTFFVVDRRIVVDEAGWHAKGIADLLNVARPETRDRLQRMAAEQRRLDAQARPLNTDEVTVLDTVASLLRSFGGEKTPLQRALHVSVLRGGMYQDRTWAEAPNQPTVCLSTVDQIGSRLLFRGYGVSEYQRAIHAGLLGNDSLILVDEAHLSRAFLGTLQAVEGVYRTEKWAEQPIRTPFQVVSMSATFHEGDERFGQSDPEWQQDSRHPVLQLRLGASKLARLKDVSVGENEEENRESLATEITAQAILLSGLGVDGVTGKPKRGGTKGAATESAENPPPAHVIGVVVNRVDTARRVCRKLQDRVRSLLAIPQDEADDLTVILLTGRIRPYDRDDLLFRRPIRDCEGWFPFIEAKGSKDYARPAPPRGKLFVVATQTIEVGANLSFDALVTEAAPLDSLRQRFGRLDRLGFRKMSEAVIVARKDSVNSRADDPVYGTGTAKTWEWLKSLEKKSGKAKRIDFGLSALELPEAAELAPLCAPSPIYPTLLPTHVDNWVQTTPTPVPDPDVSLFLHGEKAGPADVNVVWRADLTGAILQDAIGRRNAARRSIIGIVSLVPPTSMEALPVPLWQVRAWLRGLGTATVAPDIADVEGKATGEDEKGFGRPFLRWRGPDDTGTMIFSNLEEIQPGDTIIVPSEYGGTDGFGWNPVSEQPVPDVADDCSWQSRRRPALRVFLTENNTAVHRFAIEAWDVPPDQNGQSLSEALSTALSRTISGEGDDWSSVEELLGSWKGLPPFWRQGFPDRRLIDYPFRERRGVAFVLPVQPPSNGTDSDDPDETLPAGDDSSLTSRETGLEDHCNGVRDEAERLALAVGLTGYAGILKRAGELHDVGKADPRFQLWLYGGNESAAAAAGYHPLAKSDRLIVRNRTAIRLARLRAGWPAGARHEALSVLLVEQNPAATEELTETDRDLLLYLIGSHHGRGRPFWPFPEEEDGSQGEAPDSVACEFSRPSLALQNKELLFRPELELARPERGWIDLFWRLVRRHGYWGLAYLEALLILADHRESQRGEPRRGRR